MSGETVRTRCSCGWEIEIPVESRVVGNPLGKAVEDAVDVCRVQLNQHRCKVPETPTAPDSLVAHINLAREGEGDGKEHIVMLGQQGQVRVWSLRDFIDEVIEWGFEVDERASARDDQLEDFREHMKERPIE